MTGLSTCTCAWKKTLPNCLDNGSRDTSNCEVGIAWCMGSGVMGTVGGFTKIVLLSHIFPPIFAGVGAAFCCLGIGCPIPTCKFTAQQVTGPLPSSVAAVGQATLSAIDQHETGSAKCDDHIKTEPESL